MDRNRPTERMFEFFGRKKAEPKWLREVKIDLAKMGSTEEDIRKHRQIYTSRRARVFPGEEPAKNKRSYKRGHRKQASDIHIMKIY